MVERMNVVQQGHPWTYRSRCVARIWRRASGPERLAGRLFQIVSHSRIVHYVEGGLGAEAADEHKLHVREIHFLRPVMISS